jgi:hypothetical protein
MNIILAGLSLIIIGLILFIPAKESPAQKGLRTSEPVDDFLHL